jgi:hypothetical protein
MSVVSSDDADAAARHSRRRRKMILSAYRSAWWVSWGGQGWGGGGGRGEGFGRGEGGDGKGASGLGRGAAAAPAAPAAAPAASTAAPAAPSLPLLCLLPAWPRPHLELLVAEAVGRAGVLKVLCPEGVLRAQGARGAGSGRSGVSTGAQLHGGHSWLGSGARRRRPVAHAARGAGPAPLPSAPARHPLCRTPISATLSARHRITSACGGSRQDGPRQRGQGPNCCRAAAGAAAQRARRSRARRSAQCRRRRADRADRTARRCRRGLPSGVRAAPPRRAHQLGINGGRRQRARQGSAHRDGGNARRAGRRVRDGRGHGRLQPAESLQTGASPGQQHAGGEQERRGAGTGDATTAQTPRARRCQPDDPA